MYVLMNRQMRDADRYTIETLGVPSLELMERAGIALADEAEKLAPVGKIVCVCGGGNNGGDGFVCARILRERGREVGVVFYSEKNTPDCCVNRERWQAVGGTLETDLPDECDLIVDCLYGTGFHGALSGMDEKTVRTMNALRARARILSADIPSGICGDDGCVQGVAVCADRTLCIGERKAGVLLGDGIDLAGEIVCADIGIALPEKNYAVLTDKTRAAALLPKRKRNSHKGSYGRAAIVAGSEDYTGAAYLAAAACLRAGAGYTTLFVPKGLVSYYFLKLPEVLLKPLNGGGRYEFNATSMKELLAYDSVAYGMGMGVSEAVAEGAAWLVEHFSGRLIIDADGLNSLATFRKDALRQIFAKKKCDVLLTPHVKEFSRLSGKSVEEISREGLTAADEFAKEYGVNVLLKNAVSILSDGERISVNTTGTSGQAKGGSGDVLSGVIAGLCAMGLSAYEGGLLGGYLTGCAAELATEKVGEYSLTASDVIAYLGGSFLGLR